MDEWWSRRGRMSCSFREDQAAGALAAGEMAVRGPTHPGQKKSHHLRVDAETKH
jgi:hypothetical protein